MQPIKLFMDTEFTGLHQQSTLISLGIVSIYGDTFYAEFNDYDTTQVDNWIKANVIDKLEMDGRHFGYSVERAEPILVRTGSIAPSVHEVGRVPDIVHTKVRASTTEIKEALLDWIGNLQMNRLNDKPVVIVSDCLAYDWVLFNEMFGGALNLPKQIFYIPLDLSTMLAMHMGNSDVSREAYTNNLSFNGQSHNALQDAQMIKECYFRIMSEGVGKTYEC